MFAGTLQCKHVLAISLSLSAYVLPLTPAYTRGPLIMSQSLILADWCLARPIGAYLQFDNVRLTLTVVVLQIAERADLLQGWGVCPLRMCYLHVAVHI